MITLYRFLQKQEHTLVAFQGDQSDVEAVGNLCGIRPRLTKRPNSYEREYYLYLRGENRAQLEKAVHAYLQQRYVGPEVEMLRYRSRNTLVLAQSTKVAVVDRLAESILSYFSRKHHRICGAGGLGQRVFRSQAFFPTEGIRVHDGITFRLYIDPQCYLIVQLDLAFRYELEGSEKRRADVLRHVSDQPETLRALQQFELRSTDEIFHVAHQFIRSLARISPELEFEDRPIGSADNDWEAWHWSHDHRPVLMGGNNQRLDISLDIHQEGVGFFQPPENAELIILFPDDPEHVVFPNVDGRQFSRELTESLRNLMPQSPLKPTYHAYPLQGPLDGILEAVNHQLESEDRHRLVLLLGPSDAEASQQNPELQSVRSQTNRLQKEIRRARLHSYVASCDWDGLANNYDRQYIIQTALLKGLTVLGGIPWRIENMPFDQDANPDDVCFIGVDVNPYRNPPVAGGVVVDGYGRLCGYHIVRLAEPRGDQIGKAELKTLLDALRQHYRRVTERNPEHIIYHRDGLISMEEMHHLWDALQAYANRYDLVEVRKSGAPRLRQAGNVSGTPSKDIALGSERLGRAILCNTLSVPHRADGNDFVFPSSNSILVKRRDGVSATKTLSAQVHLLSLAHYANFHRTVQLPITIAYADAVANKASLGRKQETGCPITQNTQAYWL